MSLVSLRNVTLSFGTPPLLEGVNLEIGRGERACLIGRNGEGKSTLLKVIGGELTPDEGEVRLTPGTQVAMLRQEVPAEAGGRVFDVVAGGLRELGELVSRYHSACREMASRGDEGSLRALSIIQQEMEAADGWRLEQRVEEAVSRLGLEPDAAFKELSGGMKRRVLLARALVSEPDLLLLDEPTNHLDIESITWLEEFLAGWPGSLLFVTHDRAFLERLATRILELDRGRLTDWPGDYRNYLRRKEEREKAEAQEAARFQRRLAQEEIWIRQGIKARRTRNEGRVRRLKEMREQARQRRQKQGKVRLQLESAGRSGKLVCEAEGVNYSWQGRPIIRDFSTTILRGDRVGIIGPNGCGKTTLLELLLGRLQPDAGTIRLGTGLEVAYFDQMRAQLDEEASVVENVGEGRETVTVNGRQKHVIGYLQDFLFTPARARQPVKSLSGGERNRLLLAKLFTRPANLLVLDEPTNDLDIETLELLEELLLEFDGTLLLVSHDRAFLDNVVTSTLVFEGEGKVNAYVGGYSDWLAQRPPPVKEEKEQRTARPSSPKPRRSTRAKKLSYREEQELQGLPAEIEALEEEKELLARRLSDPDLYRQAPEEVAELSRRLQAIAGRLEDSYARWEALEKKRERVQAGG